MGFNYLVGDIGGTNARLIIYNVPEQGDETMVHKSTYKSQNFSSLTDIINKFFADEEIEDIPQSACFSVAGPVKDGCVSLTNLGWSLSQDQMQMELGIARITFLNDFAACGYGIKLLSPEELVELTENKIAKPNGPKVIIGAGTGLGEAYIFEHDGEFTVVPGEGGHTDFAPRNRIEFDLMMFIKSKLILDRVGVERIISGPGLENIYWFFVSLSPKAENPEVSTLIRNSNTAGAIISKLAIDKEDVLCQKALQQFISSYGAETGNMALSVLPTGGVYIAGGIAPKLCNVMKDDFLAAFYDKGRMRSLLAKYPVNVVMNLNLGLLGARYIARKTLSESSDNKIGRDLSMGDIQSLSTTAELVTDQEKIAVPKVKRTLSGVQNVSNRDNNREAVNVYRRNESSKDQSTLKNIAWMAMGAGFTLSLVAAYVLGKVASSSNNNSNRN